MGADPKYGARPLNLAVQAQAIRVGWPGFEVAITPSMLTARGVMQPLPTTHSYTVRIVYKWNEAPKVFVETPALHRRDATPNEEIPHTYGGSHPGKERPCTFFPATDWGSTLKIADTVIPWLAQWLIDYELWHATGTWRGGGVSHSKRITDGNNQAQMRGQ